MTTDDGPAGSDARARRNSPLDRRMQVRISGAALRRIEGAARADGVGAAAWVREAAEARLAREGR